MIQPLGGNIKVYRLLRDPKVVALLSLVMLFTFLIANDRFADWKEVVFIDGGSHAAVRTQAHTVGEFLREQGITLARHDRLNLSLGDALGRGTRLELFRIEEKLVERDEPIPFATRTLKVAALPEGRTLVVAPGREGSRRRVAKVILRNGVECASEVLYTRMEQPPRDRVVFRGTGPAGDPLRSVAVRRAVEPSGLPVLYVPPAFLPENTLVAAEGLGRLIVRASGAGREPFTVAGRFPHLPADGPKELRLSLVR